MTSITDIPPKRQVHSMNTNPIKEIHLTQGKVALVDDSDFEWLNKWKWRYLKERSGAGYAVRWDGKHTNRKAILMHNEIMRIPLGLEVDHIDHNGLNNQRANLRFCTHSQNMMNRLRHNDNMSGYKGVSLERGHKKWRALISINGKQTRLGIFDTPEAAARAYDEAARKYHDEFANINGV